MWQDVASPPLMIFLRLSLGRGLKPWCRRAFAVEEDLFGYAAKRWIRLWCPYGWRETCRLQRRYRGILKRTYVCIYLCVLIEALSRLDPQLAFGDHFPQQHARRFGYTRSFRSVILFNREDDTGEAGHCSQTVQLRFIADEGAYSRPTLSIKRQGGCAPNVVE